MKKTLFTKGFTMVETLVAVAILMIAIAGPLTIAQKGLTAAIYARDQVTASFLAQDAMEYIKNVRDYNLENNPTQWLLNLDGCTSASKCGIDTTTGSIGSNFDLYHDGNGYKSSGGIRSQFIRSFYIDTANTSSNNQGNEATVVVQVSWTNGTVANAVTFENQIFNKQR